MKAANRAGCQWSSYIPPDCLPLTGEDLRATRIWHRWMRLYGVKTVLEATGVPGTFVKSSTSIHRSRAYIQSRSSISPFCGGLLHERSTAF